MTVIEKKHRLDSGLYRGATVSFTCCIKNREPFFNNHTVFDAVEKILLDSLESHRIDAHIYLFMPDHVHLLLGGQDAGADVFGCICDFKQKSGYWLGQNSKVRWQKDFFDHILRKDEDILKQVYYILNNPVRNGMVTSWKEYPYKGSTKYDLDKL